MSIRLSQDMINMTLGRLPLLILRLKLSRSKVVSVDIPAVDNFKREQLKREEAELQQRCNKVVDSKYSVRVILNDPANRHRKSTLVMNYSIDREWRQS